MFDFIDGLALFSGIGGACLAGAAVVSGAEWLARWLTEEEE